MQETNSLLNGQKSKVMRLVYASSGLLARKIGELHPGQFVAVVSTSASFFKTANADSRLLLCSGCKIVGSTVCRSIAFVFASAPGCNIFTNLSARTSA